MKKLCWLAFLLLVLPFISGMGFSSGTSVSETIPQPSKFFSAVFLDQMDIATECSEISIEGKTFFDGRLGKGTYIVSFENIEKVLFFTKNEVLTARVVLKQKDEPLELILKEDLRAFGRTGWGTFQIRLGDLKSMTITGS